MNEPIRRGVTSFGQRARREDLGLPPEPEVELVGEPVAVSGPGRAGTVEITVIPTLDEQALNATLDRLADMVREAFRRGVSEGLAEAESLLGTEFDPATPEHQPAL